MCGRAVGEEIRQWGSGAVGCGATRRALRYHAYKGMHNGDDDIVPCSFSHWHLWGKPTADWGATANSAVASLVDWGMNVAANQVVASKYVFEW